MPVRRPRRSDIAEPARRVALEAARSQFDRMNGVRVHSVLSSEDDHQMAPTETNALRIVIEGWAASLHRTAIPILIHLDADGSRDTARTVRKGLATALSSQMARTVKAHRAGIRHPQAHDPFPESGTEAPPAAVNHLDGQRYEMDVLIAQGGFERVREVYGTLARDILLRRAAGVSEAYDGGTLVDIEISARIRLGANAELKGDVITVADVFPESVMDAARGRRLGDVVRIDPLGDVPVAEITRHDGNRLSKGLRKVGHSRIALAPVRTTCVGGRISGNWAGQP